MKEYYVTALELVQVLKISHGAFDAVEVQNKESKVIQIINEKSIEL